MFNFEGFVRPAAIKRAAAELLPLTDRCAYTLQRRHNVYFKPEVAGLKPGPPALHQFETINRTLCGDQLAGKIVQRIYEWEPLPAFLAAVLERLVLYLMSEPRARQRHGVPGGRGAQLALRSLEVHDNAADSGPVDGGRIREPQRAAFR